MGCIVISEATIGAVEYLGKFSEIIEPGFHCLIPCVESLHSVKQTNMQILNTTVETITSESLAIKITVGIQYKIIENESEISIYSKNNTRNNDDNELLHVSQSDKSYKTFSPYQQTDNNNIDYKYNAIYLTANPQLQIQQHIETVFREISCGYTMKELFLSKSKVSEHLTMRLNKEMNKFGYMIYRVLIQDIDPPNEVKHTMNLVLSSQNKRDAMINEAEAKKKAAILEAEGMCEVRRLEGVGLANQRKALAEGLAQSISSFGNDPATLNTNELTNIIIKMQQIEMLHTAAHNGKNTFIVTSPDVGSNDLESKMRNALLSVKSV